MRRLNSYDTTITFNFMDTYLINRMIRALCSSAVEKNIRDALHYGQWAETHLLVPSEIGKKNETEIILVVLLQII